MRSTPPNFIQENASTSETWTSENAMRGSRITGMGHYSDRVVTNDDLAQIIDTWSEWIIQRTGIEERRWSRVMWALRTCF